ncbi:MAG TPA: cytochrome c maturation protein CcmE [Nitrospiria bacterium]|nr:cytochrome c maturation protein CcmE [Nitrospiria bacterium]
MKGLYLRWGGLLLVGLWIAAVGTQRYNRDVRPLTPDQVLKDHPAESVRMLGMIEAGSLRKDPVTSHRLFFIVGKGQRVPVDYQGSDTDDLRELKTLVVVGRWDNTAQQFVAQDIDLIPNYGFIIAAYLVMIPLALFLFMMERRVRLLYNEIKQSKQYEPDVGDFE